MAETWVANASPLIALGKVGRLDLLRSLSVEVVIPEPVTAEVLAGPAEDAARRALEAGWGTRVPAPPVPPDIQEWGLGAGESAVIAVARGRAQVVALLDDAQARKCALSFGVAVKGTLGIVALAKRRGLIPSFARVIQNLRATGLYVDDRLVQAVVKSLGEKS